MVWKIYPWNNLASVKFHTITVVGEGRWEHISLHLLYCAVQLFVRISSGSSAGYLLASRALSELQQAGALHGSQGRVCGLAPPWSCAVLSTGCAILPRCFCGQGRQLACTVHEGYICCAVLVCLCKPPRRMYARENWLYHWRWHQWPKGKAAILPYLTITEV